MVFNLQTHQSPRKLADGSNISISVNGDIAYTTHAPDGTTIGAMLDRFGRQAPNPGGSGRFSWSPDGRWLASSSGYMGDGVPMPQYIMDFDFRTGRVRQFAETLPCNCDGGARVVWAPDSARFQFTRLTGSPSQRLPLSELYEPWGLTRVQAPSLLAWLDATHYSTLPESDEPRYSIYDVVTGARIPLSAAAVPSPSGDLLATREGPMNGTFVVLRTDGSLVLNELEGRFEAWSSDGSYILAATGEFGPRAGLRVFNHAGNLVYSRDGAAGTFSPDATKLAAVESRFADPIHASTADLWIVDLATGIERKVASDLRGGLGCAKWSEDSRYVAVTFCPGV
jgi:Tol biopolymer transport system component